MLFYFQMYQLSQDLHCQQKENAKQRKENHSGTVFDIREISRVLLHREKLQNTRLVRPASRCINLNVAEKVQMPPLELPVDALHPMCELRSFLEPDAPCFASSQ